MTFTPTMKLYQTYISIKLKKCHYVPPEYKGLGDMLILIVLPNLRQGCPMFNLSTAPKWIWFTHVVAPLEQ